MTGPVKTKPPVVKLEPGTDLVGTVKYVSYYPKKPDPKDASKTMSDQWGLTGTFNGQEARLFINAYQITSDIKAFIQQDGEWPDGNPKHRWIATTPIRLHPYVKEKRHYVDVTLDGEKNGSPPIQQGDAHEPYDGGPDREATAFATVGMVSGTPTVGSQSARERWTEMQEVYAACYKIAAKAVADANQVTEEGLAGDIAQAIARSANTLFIEANKRNLPAPPKRDQP